MNLTDSDILKFLRGGPVFIDDICAVYSLTWGEIIDEGYDKFQQYLSVMTTTKPIEVKDNTEMEEIMEQITDFQYLLLISSIDSQINDILKRAFLFLTHSSIEVSLDPPALILTRDGEEHVLDEEHFADLQHLVKRMYWLEADGEDIVINKDDDPMTKRIKMNMRRNRERVRRAKAKKAAQEKSDLKISDLIGSMAINDCGLNIVNIWDMTYYAFHDQLKRMGWRDQFNINQKAALAGAKINKSQLKHWMRSIADDK